jgi:glycosyltransferase involved in cell wall biosynthesis
MSRKPPLVCLITPGHVASTPRLVKNADSLAAAGYRVHVVAGRHYPPANPLDAAIFAKARWTHEQVDYGSGLPSFWAKVLRRVARRRITRPGPSLATAARAHQAVIPRLAAAAGRVRAELYFGHCLAGLPAAAFAARRSGVPYGFDAEDFHDAETEDAAADPAEAAARRQLQSSLLPSCAIFTAASPLIAREYGRTYGREALPLLNVFPLDEAPPSPADPGPITPERPARLYWFSQTIGPGRGLEAVVAAAALMGTPVELRLRGFVSGEYQDHLKALSARKGLKRPIVFLPPGAPAEMARLAADADLGLSIEQSLPLNRDLCLTNKIFVYLLAGIPQLLSDTQAQSALAPQLGAAALLGSMAEPEAVARKLDAFFANPARVSAARRAAWDLARQRFNWEIESRALIEAVSRAVPR